MRRKFIEAALQFDEAQHRHDYLAIVLRELVEDRVRSVPRVNGDIGVDKYAKHHSRSGTSIGSRFSTSDGFGSLRNAATASFRSRGRDRS